MFRSGPVTLACSALLAIFSSASADNPIIQTVYTADPAPVVHDGTLYLYTSHDEDELVENFFTMRDWRCFSTTDMVNWTDHGAVASLKSFSWAGTGWGGGFENGAWAPQAIERDGKWYLYVPLHGRGIGVLAADRPFGPFADPVGKPLIPGDHIDPTVFIDGDGQAYLSWGNPQCWYAKLNKDMISVDASIGENGLVSYEMTVEGFGKRSKEDEKRPTTYEEGPWLYKRGKLSYLFFGAGPLPEHLGYSTGPSPAGPWKYGGVVMEPQSAFTNHPGVVDFKGKTYLFYHNAGLPGGGGFHRSVCVDELTFNADGSVNPVKPTKEGPEPVGTLNPYARVEAETIAWTGGVETRSIGEKGFAVTDIDSGDFIKIRNVDFGRKTPTKFSVVVASEKAGGVIQVRLDSEDAAPIAEVKVGATGGLETWKPLTSSVQSVGGMHDLYFTFQTADGARFDFDCWKFQ
ncbi:MAG: family 43 glycosylhydrolase [Akkermansiaceae bacterium]|nr:family 43 glycosylhydrolase [Akkermansiaceae bacterium]